MLLSRFDQESALGESLWAAANSTPPGCAAELSWHIQVRPLLNYIKLGDVQQPLTGIQCWDCTTTSPKETPKTRMDSTDAGLPAASIQCPVAWPALGADMASQQRVVGPPASKIWMQRLSNAYSPSKTLLKIYLCQHPTSSDEFKIEIPHIATGQDKKSQWNSLKVELSRTHYVWKDYEYLA